MLDEDPDLGMVFGPQDEDDPVAPEGYPEGFEEAARDFFSAESEEEKVAALYDAIRSVKGGI